MKELFEKWETISNFFINLDIITKVLVTTFVSFICGILLAGMTYNMSLKNIVWPIYVMRFVGIIFVLEIIATLIIYAMRVPIKLYEWWEDVSRRWKIMKEKL